MYTGEGDYLFLVILDVLQIFQLVFEQPLPGAFELAAELETEFYANGFKLTGHGVYNYIVQFHLKFFTDNNIFNFRFSQFKTFNKIITYNQNYKKIIKNKFQFLQKSKMERGGPRRGGPPKSLSTLNQSF